MPCFIWPCFLGLPREIHQWQTNLSLRKFNFGVFSRSQFSSSNISLPATCVFPTNLLCEEKAVNYREFQQENQTPPSANISLLLVWSKFSISSLIGVKKARVHWWGICKPDEQISKHLTGTLSKNTQWLHRIEIFLLVFCKILMVHRTAYTIAYVTNARPCDSSHCYRTTWKCWQGAFYRNLFLPEFTLWGDALWGLPSKRS